MHVLFDVMPFYLQYTWNVRIVSNKCEIANLHSLILIVQLKTLHIAAYLGIYKMYIAVSIAFWFVKIK